MSSDRKARLARFLALDESDLKPGQTGELTFVTPLGEYFIQTAAEADKEPLLLPKNDIGGGLIAYLVEPPKASYLKKIPAHIDNKDWTEADVFVLRHLDKELLQESIRYLQSEKDFASPSMEEAKAKNEDMPYSFFVTGDCVMPFPLYQITGIFYSCPHDYSEEDISKAGMIDKVGPHEVGNRSTPWTACSYICVAFKVNKFFDDLFVTLAKTGVFLELLMKLEDDLNHYESLSMAALKAEC